MFVTRWNTTTFKAKIKDINPNIKIIGEYVNSKTKIECKCLIDGNIFFISPDALLNGQGCSICGRKRQIKKAMKSRDDFIKQLATVNENVEVIGEYNGYHRKMLFKCKIHGIEWMTYPKSLMGGHGCPECAKAARQKAFSKTHEQFVLEMAHKNPEIEVIGKYKTARATIKCRCRVDGHIWNATPDALLRGQGCPICNGGIKKTHRQFIDELREINPYIQVLGKYINTDTKIKCKCLRDGNVWMVTPNHLLRGIGCPKCKQSHGERKVEIILNNNNIRYMREYRFNDCRYKQPLPFDFYLPDYNVCIEYDGSQHFKPYDRWGGEAALISVRKRDSIKTNYCKCKGIGLIRIPYTVENIEQFLQDKLNKVIETTITDQETLGI
jgi:very-short-patch-repair endonuclease